MDGLGSLITALKMRPVENLVVWLALVIIVVATVGTLATPDLPDTQRWRGAERASQINALGCGSPDDGAMALVFVVEGKNQALEAADYLCPKLDILADTADIQFLWGLDDGAMLKAAKTLPDKVLFTKPHIANNLAVKKLSPMARIGHYPPYGSYFVTLDGRSAQLSRAWFTGKRLGILGNESSRSGHLIPLEKLRTLGVDGQRIKLVKAESHQELRALLMEGRVDVIASYWGEGDKALYPTAIAMPLEEGIEGAGWYMTERLIGTPTYDALVGYLRYSAEVSNNAYFQSLMVDAQ
jgi:hypothetical protein